jgi:SAM-dependent methyltransferase
MMEAFGRKYNEVYDVVYSDKDYKAECDLLDHIFTVYSRSPPRKILDLGCGTGNHAVQMAGRGYYVVGVDRSDSAIVIAKQKASDKSLGNSTEFYRGDIRSLALRQRFDAALMMFAVLSYQLENGEILDALSSVRRHLHVGGLFIFDVWYGPAVTSLGMSEREKVVPGPHGMIVRKASGTIDLDRHRCDVHYVLYRNEEGRVVEEAREHHAVRYYFPDELRIFLESTGFELRYMGAFPEYGRLADATTWNVMCVAEAV